MLRASQIRGPLIDSGSSPSGLRETTLIRLDHNESAKTTSAAPRQTYLGEKLQPDLGTLCLWHLAQKRDEMPLTEQRNMTVSVHSTKSSKYLLFVNQFKKHYTSNVKQFSIF